jgi:hypothetical protein
MRVEKSRKIPRERMLFTLDDIKKVEHSIFARFLDAESRLMPVFDLFFPTYFFPLPPPQELLNAAHAIEALHRATVGGQYQSDEDYASGLKRQLLQASLNHCPKSFEAASVGNSISFINIR